MLRSELKELHYITPIENIPSILKNGILSYCAAKHLRHRSVALDEIQKHRKDKRIPNGYKLHEYVNLYINARNPMMFRCKNQHRDLCILRINESVLDLDGVIIADQNAASKYGF